MSSLGDLLLAHMKSSSKIEKVSESGSNDCNKNTKDDEVINQDSSHSADLLSHKVFPERIEKNEFEDAQSNASSTDDYVRELLDPDDRPKNVWHVVEAPKTQSDDTKDAPDTSSRQSVTDKDDSSTHNVLTPREYDGSELGRKSDASSRKEGVEGDKVEADASFGDGTPHDDHDGVKSHERRSSRTRSSSSKRRSHRETSRERSSSSRRHRHHGHDRDRERDRDRDRRRYREGDDYDRDRHRSSRRRHVYSDDDDDDYDYDRRHKGGSHRSHRRSRSRSKTSSRRRDRSRSDSQSPITKRNSRTILIMQLSPRVTSRDLEDFFSDIGRVREVRLIMDSKTRRHKGIAYIEFEEASSAAKAFSLNGQNFFDAPVVIQSAQIDRSSRSTGEWHTSTSQTVNHASSNPSSRSHLPPNCYRVYVGGLNVNLTEEMIRLVFEPFGPIVRLELMKDRVTNVSRGYAFITYANEEDGKQAVQALDGFELAGKALRVSKSTEKVVSKGYRPPYDSKEVC